MAKTKLTSKKKTTPSTLRTAEAKSQKKTVKSGRKSPKMEAKKVIAEIVDDSSQETLDESAIDQEAYQKEAPEFEDSSPDFDISIEPAGSAKAGSQLPAKLETKSLTTPDPITAYLAEIRKYPLLTKEKEQELTKKYYETKDPIIAQVLVTSNLRFVVKIAAEYSKFGARLIDLIQEGNMGLMHGVREFNPYKGVKLITYAVWWIRGYIQEYLMKQYSLVKIGTTQNQKKLFYQLQRQKSELDAMGKSPDIKTLSEKLGIPEDEVEMMANRMSGRDVSLDRPLDEDAGTRAVDLQKGDSMTPDEELAKQEELSYLHKTIESLKPHLSEREKIILDERILADEPLTLQEIGEKYGITREAVRQMEARLMKKIKDTFEASQSEPS